MHPVSWVSGTLVDILSVSLTFGAGAFRVRPGRGPPSTAAAAAGPPNPRSPGLRRSPRRLGMPSHQPAVRTTRRGRRQDYRSPSLVPSVAARASASALSTRSASTSGSSGSSSRVSSGSPDRSSPALSSAPPSASSVSSESEALSPSPSLLPSPSGGMRGMGALVRIVLPAGPTRRRHDRTLNPPPQPRRGPGTAARSVLKPVSPPCP